MKRYLMMMCLAVLAVSAAVAQEKKTVPPPPKAANDGPSLEVTMKFIQDKLNDADKLNFAINWYNVAIDKVENTYQIGYEVSNVAANPARCVITIERKILIDGRTIQINQDWGLRDVLDLAVRTGAEEVRKKQAEMGDHTYDPRFDPAVFVLVARRLKDKKQQPSGWLITEPDQLFFADEDMANRVAKAMVHAVELCGGGSKPEPF
jgi:hypothetical protein